MKINPYEYRRRYDKDIPFNCEGFTIDDCVEYDKDGQKCRAYIYCFRKSGLTWFAYLYKNVDTLKTVDMVALKNLTKVFPRFKKSIE